MGNVAAMPLEPRKTGRASSGAESGSFDRLALSVLCAWSALAQTSEHVEYLLVTSASLRGAFQPLAAIVRRKAGLPKLSRSRTSPRPTLESTCRSGSAIACGITMPAGGHAILRLAAMTRSFRRATAAIRRRISTMPTWMAAAGTPPVTGFTGPPTTSAWRSTSGVPPRGASPGAGLSGTRRVPAPPSRPRTRPGWKRGCAWRSATLPGPTEGLAFFVKVLSLSAVDGTLPPEDPAAAALPHPVHHDHRIDAPVSNCLPLSTHR